VINFWASWCPPCRIIAPYFEQLSNAAPDIIFCEVNVDDVGNVAKSQEFDIRAVRRILDGGF
jgi:thioredoxin 1